MTARRVCHLDDLKNGDVTAVPAGMVALCIARIDERVYAIADNCTHEGVNLSDGYLDTDTLHVECWRHASCFSLLTGQPDGPPAKTPVIVYPTWTDDGDVYVDL
jgi:3-phenylpropionate/trans-cinnamate dioxygenase ferredoxin subunit